MPNTILGKVSITPRGEYSPTETYKRLDAVQYLGNLYICAKECIGVTPGESQYYMLAAERGKQGPQGPQGETGPHGKQGIQGPSGEPGAPGHTPEYGVDYGTQEQIEDIANHAAGILADDIKKISDVKVDKVEGKGLSTNDYDNDAKTKVDAIPEDPKYTDTVYDDTEVNQRLNQLNDDLSALGLSVVDGMICQTYEEG